MDIVSLFPPVPRAQLMICDMSFQIRRLSTREVNGCIAMTVGSHHLMRRRSWYVHSYCFAIAVLIIHRCSCDRENRRMSCTISVSDHRTWKSICVFHHNCYTFSHSTSITFFSSCLLLFSSICCWALPCIFTPYCLLQYFFFLS